MAADPKLLLTTPPEKPNHYTYLKEFRVEQCQSFLQHKCNQHRPFICFNWHFMNQRRRRPVRKRDGTFNYSADNYCAKYDETTGICPDGDDCPFLHRTAGDTERRYHLRYYKTCMCVHDTDTRGYCVKNGHHCAFAHGLHDQRPPVFDIKEIESTQTIEANGLDMLNAPNALDKERNLMNEDPKWQDTNYVLANYKTDSCKRPPRLCRQGYACPQYHNSKDKRRSPRKFKYRSTPCPNVKHGEEWGEPANCEHGDNCQYCHTRTEQQFHPEIYKSTKCNDVQQAGYCPRSVFCAFAHVEQEVPIGLDGQTLVLGELLSNVMNADKKDRFGHDQLLLHNGSGESCESASTSSVGSNQSHSKAPGSQLHHNHNKHNNMFQNSLNNNNTNNNNGLLSASVGQMNLSYTDYTPDLDKQFMAIDNDPLLSTLEKEQHKRMCLTFSMQNLGPLEKYSNNLDDPTRRDFNHIDNPISASLTSSSLLQTQPVNIPNSHLPNSLSGILQGTSAPVNIPDNFSSSGGHTNMFGGHFNHLSGSAPKMNNSFSNTDSLFFQNQLISPVLNDGLSNSPELRISNALRDDLTGNGFFENGLKSHNSNNGHQQHGIGGSGGGGVLPGANQYSMSPSLMNNSNMSEMGRLRDDFMNKFQWEDRIMQASKACEAWRSEADESNRKAVIAEKQRDDALNHVQLVTNQLEQVNGGLKSDWRGMSIQTLKGIQNKLRTELEEVEKVLYQETTTKCMSCEEHPRSVTFMPCNHYVACDQCAQNARECPYCHVTIASQT